MSKKSVVVNYIGRKGGGAVYAYEMTKSLITNGCTIYAVIAQDIENLDKWKELRLEELLLIPTYSNKFDYIKNSIKYRLIGLPKLRKKFANVHVDAVYVPMIQPWSRMINYIFKGCQRIVTVHDPKPHSGSNSYFDWLCRTTATDADDVVILTETFRDYSAQCFRKDKEHVHVIPHGIFNYYKTTEDSNICVDYDAKKINFLFFGRITKYKGLHILAWAYEKLSNEFENITLSVVGNGDFGEYREEYSRLKNVTVTNRWINDDEVGSFFRGKNVVTVLPYTDATQSGVIPIAMEYNSLVIASNTGGLSEQVRDKNTGYLFEAGNTQALYDTMKYVIEHYDEQDKVLQNVHEYINSLSWDVLGAKLKDIIK